jgi:ribosomal protein S24E
LQEGFRGHRADIGVYSDVLHPNRANISKEELRSKIAELYKSNKDQVNVFGLQTQFGGGKTTGFALVYDSPEALKKFEPHYRLVRVGVATKIEKASRQQRTFTVTIIITVEDRRMVLERDLIYGLDSG